MKTCNVILCLIINNCLAVPFPYTKLADNLEEPLGFCIDLQGFGPTVKYTKVGLHSCRSGSKGIDEQFLPNEGLMVGYGDADTRCL